MTRAVSSPVYGASTEHHYINPTSAPLPGSETHIHTFGTVMLALGRVTPTSVRTQHVSWQCNVTRAACAQTHPLAYNHTVLSRAAFIVQDPRLPFCLCKDSLAVATRSAP